MLKQLVIIFALVSLFGAFTIAQEKPETEKKEKQECMKDSHSCCGRHQKHRNSKCIGME
jgi:hypothetical protein